MSTESRDDARSQYARLGVDAGKSIVRDIFGGVVENDFPGAFVNILRHPRRKGVVVSSHMDGDGSKMVQRILSYREQGDPTVFRGAADDALSMNTSDLAASGFIDYMLVTDVLNISGFAAPKAEIMQHVGERLGELVRLYNAYGFTMGFPGGETADLPHQVLSVVFDVNVYAEALERDLVQGNVRPGDLIWGFASDGQAAWETTSNSGIMSNGLTLARTCLMSSDYTTKHPDLIRQGSSYRGRFGVGDTPKELGGMSVGDALLSPTRQFALVLQTLLLDLIEDEKFHLLHGITINTGGGATKALHLGTGAVEFRKCMPEPPPLFRLIQSESGESWRNMYETFNCGVGIDIIGDRRLAPFLLNVERKTGVTLYELGECVASTTQQSSVVLQTPYGTFDYPKR